MLLFQPPTPTRYDLNFSIAGIPVRVHPLFWLLTVMLGIYGGILQLLIWVVVAFVSILVHELGHALVMRYFGMGSSIILYMGGGLTVPESLRWGYGRADVAQTPSRQNLISLAGPGAGFLFVTLIMLTVIALGGEVGLRLAGLLPVPYAALPFGGQILGMFINSLVWINIFWGIINLMPVYPLDGGSVARNLFIQFDPLGGLRKSLWLSVIVGGLLAFYGLLSGSIFMLFIFGLLAVQAFMTLRGRGF
jgi:Zn-dependent protease